MIRIIALGPGDPESVPALALEAIHGSSGPFVAPDLDPAVGTLLGIAHTRLPDDPAAIADGSVVVAPDPVAHAVAQA
ncbi:MAG: hypothetical protein EBU23_17150, partial [Mycobacteriaceae bacterium]|nr:hypothetical protein [Mycobacteriaceae bacterium]